MKRLQWLAASAARKLGWPGLAGCALLVLAAVWCVARVLPLQQQITERLAAQRAAATAVATAAVAVPAPTPAWDELIPSRAELNPQLQDVRNIADAHGLDIRSTDYTLTKLDGSALWRYQMAFMLETDYVSLQRFVGELLNALPNLALTGIDIARSEEAEGLVTANLRFAFYFRQE